MKENRKIVVVNQAVNYLTIGFCNAFHERFAEVALITGSVHAQGEELHPDIKVTWINKWSEKSGRKKMLSYLKALVRIYFLLLFKYRRHEVFFVSLPPMAYLLNLFLPHRFSMVIWDIYPDTFKITGMKEEHPVYRAWASLNKRSFKKAYRLFTISEIMAQLLEKYVDAKKIIIQPIWSIFQENNRVGKEENHFIKEHALQGKFVVQYSGNIGLTHNVETLVDIAELLQDEKHIVFQIIGRGQKKDALEKMVKEKGMPNCHFLPFQSDDMFPFSLSAADLGVVILDELTSKGSVPSKSYNLMSYGIPALYISSPDSQLQVYADKYQHARCFRKQELNAAAAFIRDIAANPSLHGKLSENAVKAANDFGRENATKFVELYLTNPSL